MSVVSDVRHPFLIYDAGTLALRLLTTTDLGGAASSGNVVDGADSAIKATVFDFTNSNPLAVVLRDTNGDYVSVGGGTQYAEDTVATAAEIVTMAGVVRKDTAASLVDADGDRTELQVNATGNLRTIDDRLTFANGTYLKSSVVQEEGVVFAIVGGYSVDATAPNVGAVFVPVLPATANAADPTYTENMLNPLSMDLSGRLRVVASALPLPSGAATGAKQDTGNASLSSMDGKTPALGQALAAASSPVVLTAIQLAALTPPAAITGYSLEATQLLQATAALQTSGNASLTTIAAAVPSIGTIDGQTVTYSTDVIARRIAELQFMQQYAATIDTLICAESATSQRMGCELR